MDGTHEARSDRNALFGTLAPIEERFGWHWGVVASVLVPVIIAIQSRTQLAREPPGPSGAESVPAKWDR